MGMGNFNSKRLAVGGFAIIVIGTLSFLPFTNCSQNPQNAATPEVAFLSPVEKYEVLKSEFKGRVPLSFCQSSESYGCMKKIYSRQLASEQMAPTRECSLISGELKVCPAVHTFHFNSEAAESNCNGCEETYEYMDYSCHLKIPNRDGIYPISFTEATLEQSLLKLYQFCASIAEEPQ